MAVRPRSRRRRSLTAAGLLCGATVLSGCELPNFGAPDPASREAGHILGLWQGTVIAAAVVGLFVWGLIIWSVVRYRRRSDALPNQNPENIPIEILYSIVPIVIVAVLFFFTMRTYDQTTSTSGRPDVDIEVIGFQWQWQFRYLDEGVTITGDSAGQPPAMVLPVGSTVRLRLKANDVNHSFWVPRFLSKRDLIPGVRNVIEVNVTEEGEFVGRCAEFCGLDHWRMYFSVRSVPDPEYRTWLADEQRRAAQR